MKPVSLAAILACLFVALEPSTILAADADQAVLQGKWKVESFEYNGMPVESMKDAVREFSGDKYSLTPTSGEAYSGAP